VGFLERDQPGGELHEGEVVLGLLGPADKQCAVAIHPGVAGLDDPASGAPGGVMDLGGQLLASGADVRDEVLGGGELSDHLEVIAAVQAQALGCGVGRDRAGDRDRGERRLEQLYVMTVGAVVRETDRDASALRERRALRPLLALSVGFGPVFSPPSGALVIAPSAASQSQSIPTSAS
jgi:hypothetical protein